MQGKAALTVIFHISVHSFFFQKKKNSLTVHIYHLYKNEEKTWVPKWKKDAMTKKTKKRTKNNKQLSHKHMHAYSSRMHEHEQVQGGRNVVCVWQRWTSEEWKKEMDWTQKNCGNKKLAFKSKHFMGKHGFFVVTVYFCILNKD